MGTNTFVCTSNGGQLGDEWNGSLEVVSEISKLLAGCTLNCSKVNVLGYADDLVLVAPTAEALQLLPSNSTHCHSK